MKNQMNFDFIKWEKEVPKNDFDKFKEIVTALFSAIDGAFRSLMDMGKWAAELLEMLGTEKFNKFCFDAPFDRIALNRAMRAWKMHTDLGLKLNVGRNTVMFLLTIKSEEDLGGAIKDSNDGMPYHELMEKYKKAEKDWEQITAFPKSEADVKRELERQLIAAGHEIVSAGEFRTWADRAPDLISRVDGISWIWECKHNPSREALYQALGQTEMLAYSIGRGTRRGIAYSDPEQKHIKLHALLQLLHIQMIRIVLIEVLKNEVPAEEGRPAPGYH